MSTSRDWSKVKLGKGIRLLLGWRDDDASLGAAPVEITTEVADVLRDACQRSLASLAQRNPKPYTGAGNIDDMEYLRLKIRKPKAGSDDDGDKDVDLEELLSAADMVGLSLRAFTVAKDDFLDRDDLEGGGWLFYAVVAEVEGETEPIAFVRQYNPQRGFGTGKFMGVFGDTLKKLEDPVFMFDLYFDVVVASDEVAVLSTTHFQRVFADINVVASEVPGDIEILERNIKVPVAGDARKLLTVTCQDKLRLAARLKKLSRQSHLKLVTTTTLRAALTKHGMNASQFGLGPKVTLTSVEDVRLFLDILEKRYYEEDFTGDTMRADNASPLK